MKQVNLSHVTKLELRKLTLLQRRHTTNFELPIHNYTKTFRSLNSISVDAKMVQPTTARLMQATRARFFRPGLRNQWGYVRCLAPFEAAQELS